MKVSAIQEFRKSLRTIERSVVEQLKLQTRCCGVTLAQCHTLVEIGDAGTINLVKLAQRMGLDTSTLSRTVDAMVKEGLITRATDSVSRRAIVLALTKKGAKRLAAINGSCNEFYGRMLDSIPEGKRPLLIDGVRLVADILSAKLNQDEKKLLCSCSKEIKNG